MNRSFQKRFSAAAIAVALVAPSFAVAAPTYSSYVVGNIGNWFPDLNYGGTTTVGAQAQASNGGVASANDSLSYSGMDGAGNSATMTYGYQGQAQASAAGLKVSASNTLANAFYNAGNSQYLNSSFTVDPTGTPSILSVRAVANFHDLFSVSGSTGLSYVTVNVNIDGQVVGWGNPTMNYALLTDTGAPSGMIWSSLPGQSGYTTAYNESATSARHLVNGNGQIDFGIELQASASYQLWNIDAGPHAVPFDSFYSSYVDFFNTVTIDSFAGFDVNGAPVDLRSVVGSDGRSYATVRVDGEPDPGNQVPEPGILALIGIGAIATAATRRRRSTGRSNSPSPHR